MFLSIIITMFFEVSVLSLSKNIHTYTNMWISVQGPHSDKSIQILSVSVSRNLTKNI